MLAGVSDLTAPQMQSLDDHRLVWCVGQAEAGVWREHFEWPRDEWLPVLLSINDDRFAGVQRKALRVQGDSMDLLYPSGSFVIFVAFDEVDRNLIPGDRVIVLRHRHATTEVTIKEFSRDSNKRRWLLPRSSNPAHAPILLDVEETADVEVFGLIVGSLRVE